MVHQLHCISSMKRGYLGLLVVTGCMGQLDSGPMGPGPTAEQPDAGTQPTPQTPDAAPTVTPKQLLEQWSGCLSLANFQTAQMATAWGNLTAGNQLCRNCHGTGGYSFIASNDATLYFTTMTERAEYLSKYFSVQNGDVIINTVSFQSAGAGVVWPSHPSFDPTTNAGMTALKKLYDDTKARKLANTCDPSRLKD